jgi:hypothetical protein
MGRSRLDGPLGPKGDHSEPHTRVGPGVAANVNEEFQFNGTELEANVGVLPFRGGYRELASQCAQHIRKIQPAVVDHANSSAYRDIYTLSGSRSNRRLVK